MSDCVTKRREFLTFLCVRLSCFITTAKIIGLRKRFALRSSRHYCVQVFYIIRKIVKCHHVVSLKLMDMEKGRKAVGGKIEIRMRIREPVVDKDVKVEKWKWLVIDVHLTSRKVSFVKLFVKIEPLSSFYISANGHLKLPRACRHLDEVLRMSG